MEKTDIVAIYQSSKRLYEIEYRQLYEKGRQGKWLLPHYLAGDITIGGMNLHHIYT